MGSLAPVTLAPLESGSQSQIVRGRHQVDVVCSFLHHACGTCAAARMGAGEFSVDLGKAALTHANLLLLLRIQILHDSLSIKYYHVNFLCILCHEIYLSIHPSIYLPLCLSIYVHACIYLFGSYVCIYIYIYICLHLDVWFCH